MIVGETSNGFTAYFDDEYMEVPEVIEGYYIDVLITLEEALTDGKVTILFNGEETAKEIVINGTEIWLRDLVLGGNPAEFKSGPVATWTIIITDNEGEVTVKGTIQSIISSDGFNEEKVVLAEGSFNFTVTATQEEKEMNVYVTMFGTTTENTFVYTVTGEGE